MSRARRVNANQAEIVEALRSIPGCVVCPTFRIGGGYPDLTVGYNNATVLIEIKTRAGLLTPDEQQFFDCWTGGPLVIVRRILEAL